MKKSSYFWILRKILRLLIPNESSLCFFVVEKMGHKVRCEKFYASFRCKRNVFRIRFMFRRPQRNTVPSGSGSSSAIGCIDLKT
jgi:hypothetical protein